MTTATGTPVGRSREHRLVEGCVEPGRLRGDGTWRQRPGGEEVGCDQSRRQAVPAMSIILFQSIWKMKQGGFGAKKDILKAVNEANRESFIDTFYTDADGDLWVSSYIVLTDHITPGDVTRFLQREMLTFFAISQKSGLGEHIQ